jgi:hypothetical protein
MKRPSAKATSYLVGAALIVSLVGDVFLYRDVSRQRAEVPYFLSDRPLIERSIDLYGARHGMGRDEAMRNRFPVAMHMADPNRPEHLITCVSLMLPQGWFGSTPVYCFGRDGTLRYQIDI